MHPRLKKRRDFLKIAHEGVFCPSRSVIVQYLRRDEEQNSSKTIGIGASQDNSCLCVGFTASKRVGGAVARNRAKRRLREAFEVVSQGLQLKACWIVLIAKPSTVTVPYPQLLEDLSYALGRCVKGNAIKSKQSLKK
jgi:ribonuclease P protein component